MQTKTIHPMHVLCFETQTTLREIGPYVRVVAHRLYADAVKHDLEICGPVYWLYEGADGQPDTPFSLTIALPVTAPENGIEDSEFRLKTLESFHCLTEQHAGAWEKLGMTYGQIIGEIRSSGLSMSGKNREIYLQMDFEHPEANITEVQIGII